MGYNTICGIGGEVVRPAQTIPRSILVAIAVVCTLYFTMNLSILSVVPLCPVFFRIGDGLTWCAVVAGWYGNEAPRNRLAGHRAVAHWAEPRAVDGVWGRGWHTVN